jgi:hypothetical protein
MAEKKKAFLESTWQKVVGSIVALILVGAVSFFGATLRSVIDKVYQHDSAINSLSGETGSMKGDIATTKDTVDQIRIEIARLQTLVDVLDKERLK